MSITILGLQILFQIKDFRGLGWKGLGIVQPKNVSKKLSRLLIVLTNEKVIPKGHNIVLLFYL